MTLNKQDKEPESSVFIKINRDPQEFKKFMEQLNEKKDIMRYPFQLSFIANGLPQEDVDKALEAYKRLFQEKIEYKKEGNRYKVQGIFPKVLMRHFDIMSV